MFIKSLELKNFKRFKELNLEFPSDITVVKGPNEQGKSTLVEALIAALFYDPAKSNSDIKNCKAWGCDKFYTIKGSLLEGNQLIERGDLGKFVNEFKILRDKLEKSDEFEFNDNKIVWTVNNEKIINGVSDQNTEIRLAIIS